MLSRAQLLSAGIPKAVIDQRVRRGDWQSLGRGMYFLGGRLVPWRAWAWAGVLAGGDGALLANEAAGYLWGLTAEPTTISILVPWDSRRQSIARWHFIRTRNLPTGHGSPPRTSLPDTVLDLIVPNPGKAAKIIADALYGQRTSESAIAKALIRRTRYPHRRLVTAILNRHGEGVHSELEFRFRQDVERAHGLPRGARQLRIGQTRVDVGYLGVLLIELDGRLGHEGFARFRDMARDNANLVRGLVTLRYGWEDVTTRPCEVAGQIAEVLIRAGWQDQFLRCPKCAPKPLLGKIDRPRRLSNFPNNAQLIVSRRNQPGISPRSGLASR